MRNKRKRQLNQEARKEGIHRLTTKQKKRILLWRRNRDTQPQWKRMRRYQRRATTPRHPTGKKCDSRGEGARIRQGLRREDDSSSDLSRGGGGIRDEEADDQSRSEEDEDNGIMIVVVIVIVEIDVNSLIYAVRDSPIGSGDARKKGTSTRI
jgi:hypothetical protein